MSRVYFHSTFTDLGSFKTDFPTEVVKNEPMLFNCDAGAAYDLGGPITRAFLDDMPETWKKSDIVVDSRVHMLMPGWLPCIGGWHHDDVPRAGEHDQPDYENASYRSEHLMGLVNGDICPTQFAIGDFDLALPAPNEVIYAVWHPIVETMVANGSVKSVFAQSGRYIQFDDRAMHQGTKAQANGWRWFIRVSRNTDRVLRCTNELRRQVQVYLDITKGW